MQTAALGSLLASEGTPVDIPELPECIITRELLLSLKGENGPLIGYLGELFKTHFFGYKELQFPGTLLHKHRLLKDAYPYMVLEETKKMRHYLTPLTAVLFLMERSEKNGCSCLDTSGRPNTFLCQSHRKGQWVVDLIRTGLDWRIIANPLRLNEGKDAFTFKAGRVIYLPE